MSTRSITTVRSRWEREGEFNTHANIYRHYDGYLKSQGAWLHKFLDGLAVVNGICGKMPERYVNGPGRLTAKLIAELQNDGHDPDIMPREGDVGQEFHYVVDVEFGDHGSQKNYPVTVTVYDGPVTFFGKGGDGCTNQIFKGSVREFGDFLETQK